MPPFTLGPFLLTRGLARALAPIGRHNDSPQRPGPPAGLLDSWGAVCGHGVLRAEDSLTIDNRCGHAKLRFMAKKKISSTDLIWIFHERLKAFDDHPLHGIPIAIVPVPSAGWTALTPKNVRLHRPLWENRVRAIEKELRNNYVLKG